MSDSNHRYAIGIMSGTSADGIDAVAVSIPPGQDIEVISTNTVDFPIDIQNAIRELNRSGADEIEKAGALHGRLAFLYYDAAKPLIDSLGADNIEVIGCHGQTVRHRPDLNHPYTLQLGNGAILAQRSGCAVVTDFRSADIAAGGQGAPLAPGFHRAAFTSSRENRAIINIGGIANLTHLPSNPEALVIGFDTGPGNTLMDNWIRRHKNEEYDRNGDWAGQGRINTHLLELLLDDPYFHRPTPKSTGLEYFNPAWLESKLHTFSHNHSEPLPEEDVQATLMALTAKSITNQLALLKPSANSAYICGGGAQNSRLMALLEHYAHCDVSTTYTLGIPPQWVEGAAFAWMGHRTINRLTSTLPSVTGASKPTVAGAIYLP